MKPEIKELMTRTSNTLYKEQVSFLFLAIDKEESATSYQGSEKELEHLLYNFIISQRAKDRAHVAKMIAKVGMAALFVEDKETFMKMKRTIDILNDTIPKRPQGTPSNSQRNPYNKYKNF